MGSAFLSSARRPSSLQTVHRVENAVVVSVAALVAALLISLGLGQATGFNAAVFALFALLWLGFGAAVIAAPTELDRGWRALDGANVVVQALVWLLALPLVAALFVCERRCATPVRLLAEAAIAVVNLGMFLPR